MAIPPAINEQRAKDASHRDAEVGLLVLAIPRLYGLLTDQQARVLRARVEMRGKSWTEVAAVLGLSRHAAMGCWHRAMERLPDTTSELEQVLGREGMNTRLWTVAF